MQETEQTEREQNKAFISWYIDQYLAGKVDADDLLCAIKTIKPAAEETHP